MSDRTNEISNELAQRKADIIIIEQILAKKVIAFGEKEKSLQNFNKNIKRRERRIQRDELKLGRLAENLSELEDTTNYNALFIENRTRVFETIQNAFVANTQLRENLLVERMNALQVRDDILVADELALSEAVERYNNKNSARK